MANKRASSEFYVTVKLALELGVPISAPSLEDALIKGRELRPEGLLDFAGYEYNEGSISVEGVWKA